MLANTFIGLIVLTFVIEGSWGTVADSDRASTSTKTVYVNAYTDNKGPYSELPYRDRCGMISQVQSTVIQILNTHYEYGKGIHMLHSIVEALQNDLSALKTKIYDVERQISTMSYTNNESTLKIYGTKKLPLPTLDPLTFRSSLGMTRSIQGLTWGLRNLTKMMETQDEQYEDLERKYMALRRKLKKATAEMMSKVKGGQADGDTRYLLDHYMKKQTDINGKLLHRIQALEQRIKIQADSPYVTMLHGGCSPGFIRYFTSCYLFVNDTANWVDAEKHCQRVHPEAHLVSIETREEAEYLVKYRIHNLEYWSSRYVWTGGNDMADESTWRWVGTGEELGYTNWRPGQPDNHNNDQHCIYYRADGADPRWDDWHCHAARLNYVCEIKMRA